MGENIKKIIKYVAIILGTILFLLGTVVFIGLSGITETFNTVSAVILVLIPLSIYSFYKKKKLRGFYFIVLSILRIVVIDTYSKVNIRTYGAENAVMSVEERLNIIMEEAEDGYKRQIYNNRR